MRDMLVEIWSDIVCPWCYIGKRRFEKALARFDHADRVMVRWRSFELDPSAPRRRPGTMAEHLAAKYGTSVDDATMRLADLDLLASREGLRYDLAHTKGGNTFDAHRLIHLAYEKDWMTGAATKEALLRAYFEDLQAVGEMAVLTVIGAGVGLQREAVEKMLTSDDFAAKVRQDEMQAQALGCSGVPFFVFNRAFAVPGAQDPETFLVILRRAWERSQREEGSAQHDDAGLCQDDSCAL